MEGVPIDDLLDRMSAVQHREWAAMRIKTFCLDHTDYQLNTKFYECFNRSFEVFWNNYLKIVEKDEQNLAKKQEELMNDPSIGTNAINSLKGKQK